MKNKDKIKKQKHKKFKYKEYIENTFPELSDEERKIILKHYNPGPKKDDRPKCHICRSPMNEFETPAGQLLVCTKEFCLGVHLTK